MMIEHEGRTVHLSEIVTIPDEVWSDFFDASFRQLCAERGVDPITGDLLTCLFDEPAF